MHRKLPPCELICAVCGYGSDGEWVTFANGKLRIDCPACRSAGRPRHAESVPAGRPTWESLDAEAAQPDLRALWDRIPHYDLSLSTHVMLPDESDEICAECNADVGWTPRGTLVYCDTHGLILPESVIAKVALREKQDEDKASSKVIAVAKANPVTELIEELSLDSYKVMRIEKLSAWLHFFRPDDLSEVNALAAATFARQFDTLIRKLDRADSKVECDVIWKVSISLIDTAAEIRDIIISERREADASQQLAIADDNDEDEAAQKRKDSIADLIEDARDSLPDIGTLPSSHKPLAVGVDRLLSDAMANVDSACNANQLSQAEHAAYGVIKNANDAAIELQKIARLALTAAPTKLPSLRVPVTNPYLQLAVTGTQLYEWSKARKARKAQAQAIAEKYGHCPYPQYHTGSTTPACEYIYQGGWLDWEGNGYRNSDAPYINVCSADRCREQAAADLQSIPGMTGMTCIYEALEG